MLEDEGLDTEWKAGPQWGKAVKYLLAFMNTEGGVLSLGVDDDGTVLGLELERATFEQKLTELTNQLGADQACLWHAVRVPVQLGPPAPAGCSWRRVVVEFHVQRASRPVWLEDEKAGKTTYLRGPYSLKKLTGAQVDEWAARRVQDLKCSEAKLEAANQQAVQDLRGLVGKAAAADLLSEGPSAGLSASDANTPQQQLAKGAKKVGKAMDKAVEKIHELQNKLNEEAKLAAADLGAPGCIRRVSASLSSRLHEHARRPAQQKGYVLLLLQPLNKKSLNCFKVWLNCGTCWQRHSGAYRTSKDLSIEQSSNEKGAR
jgi:hypothetical protein